MAKILRDRGWILDRVNGSHVHTSDADPLAVPGHGNRDHKPGTQRGIMRQAQLTENDLA